jgi:hypothetical protein
VDRGLITGLRARHQRRDRALVEAAHGLSQASARNRRGTSGHSVSASCCPPSL